MPDITQLDKFLKARAAMEAYQRDPVAFMVEILKWREDYIWPGMRAIARSVRDHERTAVKAGHGVSKTRTMAGLCLWFLYSFPPATVLTTATTETQLKNGLWREIREAHANSGCLFGKVSMLEIDLQEETGLRWFALGFTARPDTVTREATAFQGYHNDNVLKCFEEAAGILPEIWAASEHCGGNKTTRFVAIGNATAASGEFARCFRDPDYNKLTISVKDTPNYIEGNNRIPGVYGRDYEQRIITRYGRDSDEYRVRIEGEISRKSAPGAYYASTLAWLRDNDRIGRVPYDPRYPVFSVWDLGYTTAIWFFQPASGRQWHVLRYCEAYGLDMGEWATEFEGMRTKYGYRYGQHFAPADAQFANQYKLMDSTGFLAVAERAGIRFTVLDLERSVEAGIERTREFMRSCCYDAEGCELGLERLSGYHQKVNTAMTDDEKVVFLSGPERDGNEHGADSQRYMSLAADRVNPDMFDSRHVAAAKSRRENSPDYSGPMAF